MAGKQKSLRLYVVDNNSGVCAIVMAENGEAALKYCRQDNSNNPEPFAKEDRCCDGASVFSTRSKVSRIDPAKKAILGVCYY